MISGTIYGVVLNDRRQVADLASQFNAPPYKAPPRQPILYIKSRNCLATDGSGVALPGDLRSAEAAATVGLLIGRDARDVSAQSALSHVSALCLALDVCEPHLSYYRPAVRQRCRDGFLPLGRFYPVSTAALDEPIETYLNGEMVHSWHPGNLVRDAATLIADISCFMSLVAGDLLLTGLAMDAPRVNSGDQIRVHSPSLGSLSSHFWAEEEIV